MSGWYRQYQGQSTGRVLHFLEFYCGLRVAEEAVICDHVIKCFGETIATYSWNQDVPVFQFTKPEHRENQATRRDEAIECGRIEWRPDTPAQLINAAEACLRIGEAEPAYGVRERCVSMSEHSMAHHFARAAAIAATKLDHWIYGLSEKLGNTRADYIKALRLCADAIEYLEKQP